MIRMLYHAAERLENSDVKVYNCSPDTNLECFERVTLQGAIAQ